MNNKPYPLLNKVEFQLGLVEPISRKVEIGSVYPELIYVV